MLFCLLAVLLSPHLHIARTMDGNGLAAIDHIVDARKGKYATAALCKDGEIGDLLFKESGDRTISFPTFSMA